MEKKIPLKEIFVTELREALEKRLAVFMRS